MGKIRLKLCNGCQEGFPAVAEYWHKTKSTKDGLHTRCKECKKKYAKKYRNDNKRKIKNLQKEYRHSNKEKIRLHKRLEYLHNKEHYKTKSREWRANNLERDAETKHKRYLRDMKEIKEYNKRYYKENAERIKQNVKKWAENNPEKFRAIQCRRRDMAKQLDNSLSFDQITEIRAAFNNVCFMCGSAEKLCLDHHMPLSAGYGLCLSNTVLLCKPCNSSKHAKMPDEFYTPSELTIINNIFYILGKK